MASLANDLATFKGRRVLITGHTGFKGSWLAYVLAQAGAEVTGVALPPLAEPSHFSLLQLDKHVNSRFCDIRDLAALQKEFAQAQPDVVFHLAAQAFVRKSYLDPHTTFSTNVLGSANVLECVSGCKSVTTLVFVTSDKCYKNKEQQHGYIETDELGGIDPYSVSKAAAELVFSGYCVSAFQSADAPRVASARAGNVIGGGDWSPDRLIPDCVRDSTPACDASLATCLGTTLGLCATRGSAPRRHRSDKKLMELWPTRELSARSTRSCQCRRHTMGFAVCCAYRR
jgi:CDP-glucose 4,6-dehydratase